MGFQLTCGKLTIKVTGKSTGELVSWIGEISCNNVNHLLEGIHMEVSQSKGTPKSSKSLDHFRVETNGDLEIPH